MMFFRGVALVVWLLMGVQLAAAKPSALPEVRDAVCVAANSEKIPQPDSKLTYEATAGKTRVQVPVGMGYVPAGEFTFGAGSTAKKVKLDGYCIGKFDVTNAEYKVFLDATGSHGSPSYWTGGTFPEGKDNHPVAFVSMTKAVEYANWVSKQTGWKVALPTSEQWEKAARGPKGTLYPWGDDANVTFKNGELVSKFNFNGVVASYYLKNEPKKEVTYNNPKSKYKGTKTTIDKIAGYDESGNANYLSVGNNGMVKGWVNHATYTGFIYTDLFTSLNDKGGNTTPVGSYEAGKSAYGCYDMAGNVWNWCDTKIVATNGAEKGQTVNEIRGGSWYATGGSCKSVSIGEGRSPTGAYNTVGFRVVMIPADSR